jgi:hypothetical protein
MRKTRAAFIAGLAASAFAAACSDSTQPISAPVASSNASKGTWTSTIWQPTDDGLQYVGARTGIYESSVNGKAIVDSGSAIQLDAGTIAANKQRAETESVLARMNAPEGQFTAARVGASSSRYRPQIRQSQTTKLGVKDGKSFAIEQTTDGVAIGAPPSTTILTVDGQPIAVRNSRFRKVRGRWQTTHSSTTIIDSTAKRTLVVQTDFGGDATREMALLNGVRSGLAIAGDALAAFVLPATLHAATLTEESIPCYAELTDQLKAAAAFAAAGAALAVATTSCPITLVTCAAIPWLTGALIIADVALGVTIGNYVACLVNYNRAKDLPPDRSRGGGSGGGGSGMEASQCITVDWYESVDGGHTWKYIDSTSSCGAGRLYQT